MIFSSSTKKELPWLLIFSLELTLMRLLMLKMLKLLQQPLTLLLPCWRKNKQLIQTWLNSNNFLSKSLGHLALQNLTNNIFCRYLIIFFTRNGLIWIRLTDFERQRVALYLPMKFWKRAMCEAHGEQLAGHDALAKTYIRISDSYFWPGMKLDIKKTLILVCSVKFVRNPIPNLSHFCYLISPISIFMLIYLDLSKLQNAPTNSFSA